MSRAFFVERKFITEANIVARGLELPLAERLHNNFAAFYCFLDVSIRKKHRRSFYYKYIVRAVVVFPVFVVVSKHALEALLGQFGCPQFTHEGADFTLRVVNL